MLCLMRKRGQGVWVGGTKVSVLSHGRGAVKLGFEAPPEIKILREELVERHIAAGTIAEGREEMDYAENQGVPVTESESLALEANGV